MPTTNEFERMDLAVLEAGRTVVGAVCLRRKTAGTTKDGAPYLTIELANRTGTVSSRIWREGLAPWEKLEPGTPLHVSGTLRAGWKGGPAELLISRMEPLAQPHAVQLELNPVCPIPLPELRNRFDHVLEHMTVAGQELVRVVLEHAGEDDWWTAPAAKVMHHACVHGLAWHSIEVAEVALALARSTRASTRIHWDALLAGALLHDLAKVVEYEWKGVPIDLSPAGRLHYHTSEGAVMTMLAADRERDRLAAAGVTELDIMHLRHVQLSHHAVAEFGSPVEPRTLESQIIHHADNVSAKLAGMLDDLDSAPPDTAGWVTPGGWGRKPVLCLAAAPRKPLIHTPDSSIPNTNAPVVRLRVLPMGSRPVGSTHTKEEA